MSDPCCPESPGGRGAPYSAHWFVYHDGQGAIDTSVTWYPGGLPRTDLELALEVAAMMNAAGCPLLYGNQTGRWFMWDGSGRYAPQKNTFAPAMTRRIAGWHAQAVDDVLARVREQIALMPPELRLRAEKNAEKSWSPHRAYRKRIWDDAGQHAMASQLAASFGVDENDLDRTTGRIIVDNGVLDYAQIARDGYVRLAPHDPSVLDTRRTGSGVTWSPDARCPAFEHFIADSVADTDQRWWLLWRTACALFGLMPRKGFVNLIGERDSGKSTFTELIAWLAGNYGKSVPVDTFLAKRSGDQGFLAHELMGARFVYTHEPNASALYDVSFMKSLTGRSDRMRTRTLYEKPVEWLPQCTPFIGSNNPIRFSTGDDAMMSRQEAIRFARGYARADPHLLDRMKGELPGILRYLISFIAAEKDTGVPELPLSVIAERERMAVETEDALEFVEEWIHEGRLREDKNEAAYRCIQVQPLYQHYRYWCEDAGSRPVGRSVFAGIVGRKYPRSRSGGAWHFTGLLPA